MTHAAARASLAYSCIGHAFAHYFEPAFYIVALTLPRQFGIPYEEVLALVVLGKLLYGLLAPGAGWLGDRWSTVGMMTVYFLGLGLSAVLTGLAQTPFQVMAGLTLLGIFGAIYHPVGIAWMIRNAVNRGQAIGLNGVFGGLGPSVAGIATGGLMAVFDWRMAFLIPGLVVIAVGLAFWWMVATGRITELAEDRKTEPPPSRGDSIRAGLILTFTMLCGGIAYQALQPMVPKLFEDRLGDVGLLGISGAVTGVYLIAGGWQLVAGWLCDRFSLKGVYVAGFLLQAPLMLLAAWASGLPLLAVAVMLVSINMMGIPAENVMLAKYTPAKWRATAFGLKFVLTFGLAGLGVPLVAFLRAQSGDFTSTLSILTVAVSLGLIAALQLPGERKAAPVAPAAAE